MKHSDNNHPYLARALVLAREVKGSTSPNPAVGAVLVRENKIIAEGATQKAGDDHAEVVAIKKAGGQSEGATLYVTLEPCCHYGKTPPCTDLIIKSKIKKVVVGVLDPNPKVNGQGISQLKKAGIELDYGFLEDEINELNEDFNKYTLSQIPFGFAKYAMTLDGKIATFKGDSQWISGEQSRKLVHQLRNRVDGIMVGVNTVINDNPQLTVRMDGKFKDPIRIVLDSQGRTPINANVLQDDNKTIFVLKNKSDNSNQRDQFLKACQKQGKEVLFDDSEGSIINLKNVFGQLGKKSMSSVLIEGGSEILASAIKSRVIDKILCFIAPKIVLGREGIFPFGGVGFDKIQDAFVLKKIKSEQIDQDIMITGYIDYEN